MNDKRVEGKFEWEGNHDSKYTNWGPGLPGDDDGEDCVLMLYGGGKWHDDNCSTTQRPYICQL